MIVRGPRRPWMTAVLAAAALTAASCGGEDQGGDQPAAGGEATQAETTRLEATEFEFDPSQVTVAPGRHEFAIENAGEVVHALAIRTPDGEVETDRVQPGQSATVTANLSEPGTYELYCPVANHRELGMEGSVKVGQGGGQEQSGEEAGEEGGGGY